MSLSAFNFLNKISKQVRHTQFSFLLFFPHWAFHSILWRLFSNRTLLSFLFVRIPRKPIEKSSSPMFQELSDPQNFYFYNIGCLTSITNSWWNKPIDLCSKLTSLLHSGINSVPVFGPCTLSGGIRTLNLLITRYLPFHCAWTATQQIFSWIKALSEKFVLWEMQL